MGYRVRVDPDICIGTTQCVEAAPSAYTMNDAHTMARPLPQGSDEAILEGARACPVEAIIITDEESGEQIFP